MKTIIAILILFSILYKNYYHAQTFVWLFGTIGAMILDCLFVFLAGSLIVKTRWFNV
jgi:predicted tellurium resistance membrane protein TerC